MVRAKTTEVKVAELAPSVEAVLAGPRIPRREVWVDLPEEYPGMKILVWVNAPNRVVAKLDTGDEAQIREGLKELIIAHNGWLNEDGTKALPQINEDSFWDDEAIGPELAMVTVATAAQAVRALPNSLRATRRP